MTGIAPRTDNRGGTWVLLILDATEAFEENPKVKVCYLVYCLCNCGRSVSLGDTRCERGPESAMEGKKYRALFFFECVGISD
jgi:hypothetical protein